MTPSEANVAVDDDEAAAADPPEAAVEPEASDGAGEGEREVEAS
jgi:hypothetical protein